MKSCVFVAMAVGVLLAESGNEQALQESTNLDAAWTVTSVLRNNNELPADRLKDLQVVFRDGGFTFKQGDKTLTAGAFRVDTGPRVPDQCGDGVRCAAVLRLAVGRMGAARWCSAAGSCEDDDRSFAIARKVHPVAVR